jgi:type I restriction enzyme, S subunit
VTKGWTSKRLGDVATLQRGFDLPTQSRISGEIPLVSSSGIIDTHNVSAARGPGVVTGRSGSVGNVFFIEKDFWPLNTALYVKDFHGNDPRFIFHLLNQFDLKRFASGTGVPTLNRNFVHDEMVVIPPLSEQQRIVRILDEAFDSIATAKANTEKNLQNARALFESYLRNVFSKRGGHHVVKIGEVAKVFDGPHATPKTVDEGPIFLGISALVDGEINLGETRHVTPEDFRIWTKRVAPKPGDIVFSHETRLGQAAVIPEGLECCLGRRMGLVRLDLTRVDPQFFVFQYVSPQFREFLDSVTVHGATVDRIPFKRFPSFTITLPALPEQRRIAYELKNARAETGRLESVYRKKLSALDALWRSILHQAFSGQL